MGSNVIAGSKGQRRTATVSGQASAKATPVAEERSTRAQGPDSALANVDASTGPQGPGSHASVCTLERSQAVASESRAPRVARVPVHGNGVLQTFPPGVSGNPGGRPKHTPLMDSLRRMADSDPDAVAKGLVDAAKGGDVNAAREVFDRLYGKPTQRVEIDVSTKAYDVTMDVDDV